ncbi:MAG TPA: hypothetical protein PLI21_02155, partial [Methanomassiliicoccaceae archaeon]|nr:hypothetical protein [Methanomassiliicoccaceae archaeon]
DLHYDLLCSSEVRVEQGVEHAYFQSTHLLKVQPSSLKYKTMDGQGTGDETLGHCIDRLAPCMILITTGKVIGAR